MGINNIRGQFWPVGILINVWIYLTILPCHSTSAILHSGPVVHSNFPDPSVIQVNGSYYAFATASGHPPGIHAQVATSPDFFTWTFKKGYDAMPEMPKWVLKTPRLWSPDVNQRPDGTFVMYFSALHDKLAPGRYRRHHCVGVAVSQNVLGPYIGLEEPLSCDLLKGGSIDPDGFHDPVTGNDYVVWKVDGNSLGKYSQCAKDVAPTPIMVQQVNSTDLSTPIGPPVELLLNNWHDGPDIEAPSLVYNNGFHYLIFNSGCYSTKRYKIRYAVSRDGVRGPYHRQSRPLLMSGTKIDNTKIYAPGGFDVDPTNSSRFIFHADLGPAWFSSSKDKLRRTRAMFIAGLEFEDDGLLSARTLP